MHFLSEVANKTVKLHFKYLGTLSACLFSLTLFLSLSLLTAITCDPTLLFHDCNYMSTISIWSPIVAIGVLLATFRRVSSTPLRLEYLKIFLNDLGTCAQICIGIVLVLLQAHLITRSKCKLHTRK